MERTTDGRRVVVRPATPDDAPGMLAVTRAIAEEGVYFMIDPEHIRSEELQRERLDKVDPQQERIFVVEVDGVIAGHLQVGRGSLTKVRHTASLGLGLAPAYRGMGLGPLLMQAAEAWAREVGVRKLYLGVFSINERARRMYERMGYEVEGVQKRQVLLKDGRYVDDVLMGKWLD